MITDPCWDWSKSKLVKRASGIWLRNPRALQPCVCVLRQAVAMPHPQLTILHAGQWQQAADNYPNACLCRQSLAGQRQLLCRLRLHKWRRHLPLLTSTPWKAPWPPTTPRITAGKSLCKLGQETIQSQQQISHNGWSSLHEADWIYRQISNTSHAKSQT